MVASPYGCGRSHGPRSTICEEQPPHRLGGAPITPSDRPSDLQQSAIDALRDAPDFDALYLQQLRRGLEEHLGELRRFAEGGEAPALRAYAVDAAKTLEDGRATIRALEAAATEGTEAGRALH